MRAIILIGLTLLIMAPTACAQDAAAPAARTKTGGADISRDEYIQKAVERARRSAGKRFDKLDANHDGIVTAEERRAARAARRAATASDQ